MNKAMLISGTIVVINQRFYSPSVLWKDKVKNEGPKKCFVCRCELLTKYKWRQWETVSRNVISTVNTVCWLSCADLKAVTVEKMVAGRRELAWQHCWKSCLLDIFSLELCWNNGQVLGLCVQCMKKLKRTDEISSP